MLKSLRIANFKAFGAEQEIPLAPITLIYGPNSAGKSSIIQSILLMRQSMQSTAASDNRIMFSGEDVNLGTYASALFQHKYENKMRLGFTFQPERVRSAYSRSFSRNYIRAVDIQLDGSNGVNKEQSGNAMITAVDYKMGNYRVSLTRIKPKKGESEVFDDDSAISDFQLKDEESATNLTRLMQFIHERMTSREESARLSSIIIEPKLVKAIQKLKFISYGFLPFRIDVTQAEVNERLSDLRYQIGSPFSPLDVIRRDFIDEITAICYLGPLRSPPARHYIISGSDKHSVGTRGEKMPQLLYRRKRDVLPRINEKLIDFGIPYVLDIQSAGNTLTGDIITIALSDKNGVVVTPSDVGFGIGQLLPILVEGIVSIGKTICVEQPEIHLHPRLQACIADFLVETAKTQAPASKPASRSLAGKEFGGNQWIVETHSESLMLRFQTLIKKKVIPSSFVSVLYVEPMSDVGARISQLRTDEEGDFIDAWPHGFFEESFQEMFVKRQ